jgi:hypothetical protein
MAFGTEVHAAFEGVGWLDEETPVFPRTDAGRLVGELVRVPVVRSCFERGGRQVELFREQPVEAVMDGKWLSGVVDRLHVHRDEDGAVVRAVVIDFKTDAVGRAEDLVERYRGQMDAYRRVLGLAWPGAEVECLVLSTRLRELVPI